MAPTHSPTVLVVDDDIVALIATGGDLAESGMTVFEATDGDMALSILVARPEIEILFTDINMPGERDGVALSYAARTLSADIGIIVTSGHERPTKSELPPGCVFLEKPYSTVRLIALMTELAGCAPRSQSV
jgi:CheY-like chemotaxis protein